MTRTRWWHLVVGAAVLLIGGLIAIDTDSTGAPSWGALGLLAAFAAFYFTVGWRGLVDRRWAGALLAAIILTTAVGTAVAPTMATLQCVAFPLIWSLCPGPGIRRPVQLCVAMAGGTAAGFWISLGGGGDALLRGVVIESISLALGLGLGVWFSSEVERGQENARLLAELTAAQDQLAALHHEAGATGERERLARELHDTIAQNLTSLVMLAQRGQNRPTIDAAGVREDFQLIEEVARDALTEARALVAASAPVGVEGGLAAALDRLVATFRRETGILIETELTEVGAMPRDHEVVLLRCAQEALANVRKHSGAQTVTLRMERTSGGVVLSVRDDGVGLATAVASEGGFGLAGMQQRLALVGGSLGVRSPAREASEPDADASSGAGAGTVLTATLPVATA